MLEKVLKSALGNAEDPPSAERRSSLVVIDARVDGGPMFKRMRPVPAAWLHDQAADGAHSVAVDDCRNSCTTCRKSRNSRMSDMGQKVNPVGFRTAS